MIAYICDGCGVGQEGKGLAVISAGRSRFEFDGQPVIMCKRCCLQYVGQDPSDKAIRAALLHHVSQTRRAALERLAHLGMVELPLGRLARAVRAMGAACAWVARQFRRGVIASRQTDPWITEGILPQPTGRTAQDVEADETLAPAAKVGPRILGPHD